MNVPGSLAYAAESFSDEVINELNPILQGKD